MALSRRELLLKGATTVAVGLAVPPWLAKMVWADTGATFGSSTGGDRILVVIQLTGGNDGLNTFVPYADDAYRTNRPTLAVSADQVLHIDDHLGLHPTMTGLKGLYDQG